jgi:hypothetical protein
MTSPEWVKHLKRFLKKHFWKGERNESEKHFKAKNSEKKNVHISINLPNKFYDYDDNWKNSIHKLDFKNADYWFAKRASILTDNVNEYFVSEEEYCHQVVLHYFYEKGNFNKAKAISEWAIKKGLTSERMVDLNTKIIEKHQIELYEIQSDGKKYKFNVVKNTTEPCPHCGVPACGKENILWYEFENRNLAIIFDGGFFDLACEEFFNTSKPDNYHSLPEFMKEWNELKGWADCWDYDGYELQIEDFLKSMDLLQQCEMGKWISEEDITDLKKLASKAKTKNSKLKIVRG